MGKTTLMIKLMIKYWLNDFDKIWIVCPTYAEDDNWSYFDSHLKNGHIEVLSEVNENKLKHIWNWCKKEKIHDRKKHFLIYFDDCTGQPAFKTNQETGVMNQLFSKGRHANITFVIVVQKFTQASTIMRTNSDAFLTFMTLSDTEKDHMYKEFGFGGKKKFIQLLDDATIEPYHHFFINRQGAGAPDYYHNFKKICYVQKIKKDRL
jgi:hypothetical protein